MALVLINMSLWTLGGAVHQVVWAQMMGRHTLVAVLIKVALRVGVGRLLRVETQLVLLALVGLLSGVVVVAVRLEHQAVLVLLALVAKAVAVVLLLLRRLVAQVVRAALQHAVAVVAVDQLIVMLLVLVVLAVLACAVSTLGKD